MNQKEGGKNQNKENQHSDLTDKDFVNNKENKSFFKDSESDEWYDLMMDAAPGDEEEETVKELTQTSTPQIEYNNDEDWFQAMMKNGSDNSVDDSNKDFWDKFRSQIEMNTLSN